MRVFGVKSKKPTAGDMKLGAGQELDGIIFNKVCGGKVPERYKPDYPRQLYPPFSTDLLAAMFLGWSADGPLALGCGTHIKENSPSTFEHIPVTRYWVGPLPMPDVCDDAGLAEWETRGAVSHKDHRMAICRGALNAVRLGIAARPAPQRKPGGQDDSTR